MAFSFTNDSATISTTEYSLPNDGTVLTPQTDDCVLQVMIDFGNMVAGDEYRIRVYEKVNGAGATQRTLIDTYLTGAQNTPWVSPSLILGEGWDVTVLRTAGSDRTIGWSLRKIT